MTLTARQQQVLDAIRASVADKGYPPTIRELMAEFDILSPNGVMCHLKALEKKGALLIQPNLSRGMKVLGDAPPDNSVTLSFTPDQHTRLYDIAHAKNLSVSALCQKVLIKALENVK